MFAYLPSLSWHSFPFFAIPTIMLLGGAALSAWHEKRRRALMLVVLALVVLGIFIGGLWHALERPPLRTMGETRLWYAFFVIVAGMAVYLRWHYRWILGFTAVLSTVFMAVNLFKPEIHNKTMMPALESPYFVPHVISYIFAYALLGAALLIGLYLLYRQRKGQSVDERGLMLTMDNLVHTGLAFLMIGLLLGCLWAKVAWGNYWSWDPKETWAAITLLAYLLYLHHRLYEPRKLKGSLALLALSFLCLQICWYGINYLPSAEGSSIHVYSQ